MVGKIVIPPVGIGDLMGNRKIRSDHAIVVAEKNRFKARPVIKEKMPTYRWQRSGKIMKYDKDLIETINLFRRIKKMKDGAKDAKELKTIADKLFSIILAMETDSFNTGELRQEALKKYHDFKKSIADNLINSPMNEIFKQLSQETFPLLKRKREKRGYRYFIDKRLRDECAELSFKEIKKSIQDKGKLKLKGEAPLQPGDKVDKEKPAAISFTGKLSKLVIDLNRGLITIEFN